jgi:uncharacterized membrane protein YsdA (DUF1294 family)
MNNQKTGKSLENKVPAQKNHTNPYAFYTGAAMFIGLAAFVIVLIKSELSVVSAYFIGVSVAALVLCGFDKGIAGSKSMRVPERVFWGLALIGGSAGLLLGMNLFRHKTSKASFWFLLMLVLALQLILIKILHDRFGLSLVQP